MTCNTQIDDYAWSDGSHSTVAKLVKTGFLPYHRFITGFRKNDVTFYIKVDDCASNDGSYSSVGQRNQRLPVFNRRFGALPVGN